MKLEVSKRDAYIMAETLWEAAMDLDIAAKGRIYTEVSHHLIC